MVKRKEVKINEEQIRSMMTGDIPTAVMEKIYGDNAAGSPKEDCKESETENRSGVSAKLDKVEDSNTSSGEEVPTRSSGRKHAGKRTACRIIPNICLITTL